MSKKHTYVFQFTVRDGMSSKTTITTFIAYLATVLCAQLTGVKYLGTVDCVATFTVSSDADAKALNWLKDIEEHVRTLYYQEYESMKVFYNFEELGVYHIYKPDMVKPPS